MRSDYEIVIQPGHLDQNYWRDLWHYRELFRVLAWRDVSVRYKQTLIGALWALIRPFLTMLIFTVIFGKIAGLPSEGNVPYALMVFAGMLPWTFFSTAFVDASNSLMGNAGVISKVYFPRLIAPTAAVVVAFVDFLINFIILIGLMVWYQFVPSWHILLLPFFVVIAFFCSLGPALWCAGLNIMYRDFRFVIPFLMQLGLYVSPVGFTSNVVPEHWRLLYSLNPLVGIIDGFRWCILGGQTQLYLPALFMSIGITLLFLGIGIWRFRKFENTIVDML